MIKKRPSISSLAAIVTAVLISLLAYFSPVSYTNSDPQFGLLVSQAMVQHQTVQLDVYNQVLAPVLNQSFVTLDGHIFYYFPMGTPIFSMPFVGAANLLGLDMADPVSEAALQNFISAVLAGCSFFVLYRLCRHYLTAGVALFISATAFLGSALISTVSTALWSIDFAVLFVTLSLLILTRQAKGERWPYQPYLLGFFLFATYLCRPSTFLFVALVLGYLLLVDRKTFWRTAVFSALLLAAFLVFIRISYGSWLPPYYNDFGRLAVERRPLLESYFGNLISPSRGVFVYSPFLILTLLGSIYFLPHLKRKPLFWLIVVWTLLHLLLVARTTRWWGGLSFGPRILTELLPGLVLLTAIVAQVYSERVTHRGLRIAAVGLFGGLALWAIFLNSYQALFNHYTAWWHHALAPNVEHELDYLWSWEYPPFLADNEMLCRRDRNYIDEVIADPKFAQHIYPYWPGRPLDTLTNKPFIIYEFLEQEEETAEPPIIQRTFEPVSPGSFLPALFFDGENKLDVILSGWAIPQLGYRWSMCEMTSISFKLDNRIDSNDTYELAILGGSYGEQRVEISLNGVELGQLLFNNRPNMPVSHSISIPEGVLEPGAVNRVRLNLPDSVIPETNESRRLGLALYSLTVEPAP